MPDHQTADWAIKTLAEKHDKPFFLAVGFVRPHVPFYVPKKWLDEFPLDAVELPKFQLNDLDDVPATGRQVHELPKYPNLATLTANDNEQFSKCVQAYLACGLFVDHQVGRVLEALEQSDYAENTVIVLFSDHGYHLGEKDRVSKHSLWEESTRVPLVVVANKNSELAKTAGTRSSKPVELLDIYPTLTEICGLPPKDSNQGRSLIPLMKSPESDWSYAALTTYAKDCHALRSERFRYIRYEDHSEELYDHEHDPDEWDNLAGDPEYAELLMRFRFELPQRTAAYHPSTKKAPINLWFKDHLKRNGIE